LPDRERLLTSAKGGSPGPAEGRGGLGTFTRSRELSSRALPDGEHPEFPLLHYEQDRAVAGWGPPPPFDGRGIVTTLYSAEFASGWVQLNELVRLGVRLPVEIYYRPGELSDQQIRLVEDLPLDARLVLLEDEVEGYAIKVHAIVRSRFREVLWIDTDNVPIRDPEYLFDDPAYREKGSLFWRDVSGADRAVFWHPESPVWELFRVPYNDAEEFESGQLLIDKQRCWPEIGLLLHFNSDPFYYRYVNGDKDTFRFAWQQMHLRRGGTLADINYLASGDVPYGFMPFGPFHIGPPNPWGKWGGGSVMQQRDRLGRPLFNHRTAHKYGSAVGDGRPDLDPDDVYGPDEHRIYRQHLETLRSAMAGCAASPAKAAHPAGAKQWFAKPGIRRAEGMRIPAIIHQTWKDEAVPAEFREWQESWRRHNAGWKYKLWTDAEIDALVRERFPELYGIFRAYPAPIFRVDLGRYLILKAFGGVYADLDCECLRPLEPLLAGKLLAIGLEPESHRANGKAAERGLPHILCPSFIGSTAEHPFWDALLTEIRAAKDEPDVLDATGPFLLTQAAFRYQGEAPIHVLPAALLYPVDNENCDSGRVFDIEYWEEATRDAFVIHYWAGTWWKDWRPTLQRRLPASFPMQMIMGELGERDARADGDPPKISCVMVEGGGLAGRERAIDDFLRQTYPKKELLIVGAAVPGAAEPPRDGSADAAVKIIPHPGGEATPDELRRLAVAEADGDYVCLWKGGAVNDPSRLDYQYLIATGAGAEGSALISWMSWDPASERIDVRLPERWQDTLLCKRASLAAFLALHPLAALGAPDAGPCFAVAGLDLPRVHVRREAPGGAGAGQAVLRASYGGSRYQGVLKELRKRLFLPR
jgi:mannosyltransferase OCH1-like enzyme